MLQLLKQEFEGEPSKLYINENEELQSYLMWFARMEGLPYEVVEGETKICQKLYLDVLLYMCQQDFLLMKYFKITLDKLVKMWYKQINNQGGYYGK